jgi:protein FAM32A
MGDYDYKPSGSLKLKGVKDKKIKKKKEKSEKRPVEKKEATPDKAEEKPQEPFVVHKTEAERRFEEIQRQRVIASSDVCWSLQMEERVRKNAVKSHRERVDEMNKFLDSLSDVLFFGLLDWPSASWYAQGWARLIELYFIGQICMAYWSELNIFKGQIGGKIVDPVLSSGYHSVSLSAVYNQCKRRAK